MGPRHTASLQPVPQVTAPGGLWAGPGSSPPGRQAPTHWGLFQPSQRGWPGLCCSLWPGGVRDSEHRAYCTCVPDRFLLKLSPLGLCLGGTEARAHAGDSEAGTGQRPPLTPLGLTPPPQPGLAIQERPSHKPQTLLPTLRAPSCLPQEGRHERRQAHAEGSKTCFPRNLHKSWRAGPRGPFVCLPLTLGRFHVSGLF